MKGLDRHIVTSLYLILVYLIIIVSCNSDSDRSKEAQYLDQFNTQQTIYKHSFTHKKLMDNQDLEINLSLDANVPRDRSFPNDGNVKFSLDKRKMSFDEYTNFSGSCLEFVGSKVVRGRSIQLKIWEVVEALIDITEGGDTVVSDVGCTMDGAVTLTARFDIDPSIVDTVFYEGINARCMVIMTRDSCRLIKSF